MLIKQACHDDWAKEDREFVKTHAQPVENRHDKRSGLRGWKNEAKRNQKKQDADDVNIGISGVLPPGCRQAKQKR